MGTAAIETAALECPINASQSEQFPERAKVEVEIFTVEAKQLSEQCHLLAELKERHSQSFDLVIGQRARLDPADGLSLQKLADQLDQGEHQLSQALRAAAGRNPPRSPAGIGAARASATASKVLVAAVMVPMGSIAVNLPPMGVRDGTWLDERSRPRPRALARS